MYGGIPIEGCLPSITFPRSAVEARARESMDRPLRRLAHSCPLVRETEQRDAVQDARVRSDVLVPERAMKVSELSILPSRAKGTSAPVQPVLHARLAQAVAGDIPLSVVDRPLVDFSRLFVAPSADIQTTILIVDQALRSGPFILLVPSPVVKPQPVGCGPLHVSAGARPQP